MLKTLVTGANGFVGSAICARLVADGSVVVRAVRQQRLQTETQVGTINDVTDWSTALTDVHCVIHCAARVHVMQERDADPLAEFREVNVAGTRRLAEQAAAKGVRRLVFLSSVKVNGERTTVGRPLLNSAAAAPTDAYSVSKWEAEKVLWQVAAETGLQVVILRLPLVYGPGVRANFLRLMRLVASGIPLPFGSVDNRRSMVAIDNLVDLLIRCIVHPAATAQTFFVSDDEDLSTPQLIRSLAKAMGRRAILVPAPASLIRFVGRLSGKLPEVERLIDSLQVDIRHTRDTLNWNPPVTVEEGLRRVVDRSK